MTKNYRYIYGPVPSWRLGRSLGVDPISTPEKTCPFNCTYCQLGESVKYETERKVFVPTEEIIREISSLPDDVEIDYITFSGRGEPTLAKNLRELNDAIRKIRGEPLALLTDAAIIDREEVQADLMGIDFVMAKLDAHNDDMFRAVNKPGPGIEFKNIMKGLKCFREKFNGRFALQIMFLQSNKSNAKEIAELARELRPDEVQLNTPLRPSVEKPVSQEEMQEIARAFVGLIVACVYEGLHKEVKVISKKETLYRRGKRI